MAAGMPLSADTFIPKRRLSANEKLNIGVIGIAGRGGANLRGVKSQNIVAICDVDRRNLEKVGAEFPKAKRYTEYRKMLGQNDIDAVVISTPDHTHAVITCDAMDSDRHVYCEKPLTHTVSEVQAVRNKFRGKSLVTQMGNQIHAGTNYRRVVEKVQSGMIGEVREVHVWAAALYQGEAYPTEIVPVPEYLDYEQWLGPVRYRPYHPQYLPFKWRNWWHFGGGTMADFGCHYMDLPFWALNLKFPASVEAEGPKLHPQGPPPWMRAIFDYPERNGLPPVRLHWYQGEEKPPHIAQGLIPPYKSGVLFVGSKGLLLSDYSKHQLLPEADFADAKDPEPFIPNSVGHHEEWIQACKVGGSTTSNFEYASTLTESVLLGNVAFRAGKKINWDSKAMKAVGCPEADEFIQHHYRDGWKLS